MARSKNGVRFPSLVLSIGIDQPARGEGYAHIRGWLTQEDGRLLYTSDETRGGKFKGVSFSAQGDYDTFAQEGRTSPMYGYRMEWSGDNKGLSEMKAGVAALTELERKMDRISEEYGAPASFGVWVQRLAGAIGLDKVRMPGKGYNISPVHAASAIDHQIAQWVEVARERKGVAV